MEIAMKHMLAVFVVAFLAGPIQAVAQTPEPVGKIPFYIYASAAVADMHSTYRFLQYEGFREVNPLVRGLDHRPKTMLAVGGALDAAAVVGGYHLIGKKRPKLMRAVLYGVAGFRFALALHNYRLVQPHHQRKAAR